MCNAWPLHGSSEFRTFAGLASPGHALHFGLLPHGPLPSMPEAMSLALGISDLSRGEVFSWSQDTARAEASVSGSVVRSVSAKFRWPSRCGNTYSDLRRFQPFSTQ